MTKELQKKVGRAIRLLRNIPQDGTIELAYSGGKDSDVILELARMSGIPFVAIYKNTTIDPSGTIAHCKENGVQVMPPKTRFFDLIAKKGYPTRQRRFCCEVLKEYKINDRVIQGIRRAESRARMERYKEPEVCRVYSKTQKARIYLPILDWSDSDVLEFIEERKIKVHPLYYDATGKIDITRRLGCQGCPLQSNKKRREFFRDNPKWLKAWIRAGMRHAESHPNLPITPYEAMVRQLFFDTKEEFENVFVNTGLFGEKPDAKAFLAEYFKIKL